jgi:hypothetical protein
VRLRRGTVGLQTALAIYEGRRGADNSSIGL